MFFKKVSNNKKRNWWRGQNPMRDSTFGKCSACEEIMPSHKLTKCDHCLRKFCDEHIYIGVDTGDYYLKNFCEDCMEILGINEKPIKKHKKEPALVGKSLYKDDENIRENNGNKQINLSLIRKQNKNSESGFDIYSNTKIKMNDSEKATHNINESKKDKSEIENIINNTQKLDRFEYKTLFLAVDSDVEVDEQILTHIQENYLNVFPVNKDIGDDSVGKPIDNLIDTAKLNELGDEGWEVITSIPKTKSVILMRKNGKPSTSVSANISGAYLILKRKKFY